MHRTEWSQPTLFSPEGLDFTMLTVRIDVHLDGPAGKCQAIVTVRDPHEAGDLSIKGHFGAPLESAQRYSCAILIEALEEAMRHLTPF